MDQRRTKQYPTGTRPHANGIEIWFTWPKGSTTRVYKTLDWKSSPANLIKAGKLRQEIVDAIKHELFTWSKYFPDDPRAIEEGDIERPFSEYAQIWLDSPEHNWTPQTRYKWKTILNRVWMPTLYSKPIQLLKRSTLTQALKNAVDAFVDKHGQEPSASLYNDWLTCLRGVFETAINDGVITRAQNPAAEFKNKKRKKTQPDPFDPEEMLAIIEDMYQHEGDMWGAWFEFGFFTGLRYPSEPSALTWQKVDFRKGQVRIDQIRSKHAKDGIQKSTKTGVERFVRLNEFSLHALNKARAISGFIDDGPVFIQGFDKSNQPLPVITATPQRNMWRRCLKRLGIRYRDMYNMRHSYATFGLMNDANAAFMARQLGHSLEEFFKTYATWIDRAGADRQVEFIEQGIKELKGKRGSNVAQIKLRDISD